VGRQKQLNKSEMMIYQVTDEELVDELCNARQIGWEKSAQEYMARWYSWNLRMDEEEQDPYTKFMAQILKDANEAKKHGENIEYPRVSLKYMLTPGEWREKTLQYIINEIKNSPPECRKNICDCVGRYHTAMSKILSCSPEVIWKRKGNPKYVKNCYEICCPEYKEYDTKYFRNNKLFLDYEIAKKLFILDELMRRLNDINSKGTISLGQTCEISTSIKIPGGFIGFIYKKIESMTREDRNKFLSVHSGDSSFYEKRQEWSEEWEKIGGKSFKNPGGGISKAKNIYRELNTELKS
jgi:hypothetical protein